MPEGKQEKKKTWIVKRILKWIGLGLLSLLLIAAFIFQAPWKVITLFVIILLACTVLPKPLRKFFWASVGVVVIVLIIWVFLPDDNEGWKPYTFDDELAALEAARAIPDEQNAAVIYNQLLEDYNEAAFEPNFLDPNLDDLTRKEPWSSQDYPEVAKWLKQQETTIAKLIEASKIEKCRFPIPADPSLNVTMEYLVQSKRWAFLLVRAANNDLGEGRIDAGLEKYIAVLQMGNHQRQQPTVIDILVGIAIEALATKQLNRFVIKDNPIEAHLTLIENNLTRIKHDWNSDLPGILECEKLIVKNTFCSFAYQINPKGKTRLSRDPLAGFRSEYPEKLPSLTFWQKRAIKAGAILGWFFMPSDPQEIAEIIDTNYEKYYTMAKPNYNWQKEPNDLSTTSLASTQFRFNYRYFVKHLSLMLEASYHTIHDIYLQTTAKQQASQVVIALRRYKNKTGQWPQSLDEIMAEEILIDPINNSSYVYKLTDEAFTLYSKGKNNIDEEGQYNSTYDPNSYKLKIQEDDILIWPSKIRKTKEENDNAE